MVSPHPSWEDVDDGYRNGQVGIYVTACRVFTGPGIYHSLAVTEESKANAYSVSMRRNLDTPTETWTPVVDVDAPRPAWEFANALTHYVDAAGDATTALIELLGRDESTGRLQTPDRIVSASDGNAVFHEHTPQQPSEAIDDAPLVQ